VQDVVHVGGQGGEQGVEGPVGAHLGDDDGPQRDGEQHGQQGQGPAVTCALKGRFISVKTAHVCQPDAKS